MIELERDKWLGAVNDRISPFRLVAVETDGMVHAYEHGTAGFAWRVTDRWRDKSVEDAVRDIFYHFSIEVPGFPEDDDT